MLGVRELWLIDPATVTIEVRYAAEHKGKPVWEGVLLGVAKPRSFAVFYQPL